MPARDPAVRRQVARLGAFSKWAQTEDRTKATEAARAAFLARFPNRAALMAHMQRMALLSAQARKRRAS